ncbi:NADH-quinone oxidoreductase subunit L [Mechercharimyces sp. CAU 1602]|uniref:NADH-quinone oxidoreductase subunit L n=1 Tax=Mechercharimyces sp. CAU 1602 TaxID=2973933 RepID=UPI002162E7FE|nr:NADH-quinone oxidoreductase subunit L [Mechercharimyces sp. CAU 1602]MCS1352269.1 NADH-quinone oxidoreductase subunit L [Mechercharimyces sp. CAU 1602]
MQLAWLIPVFPFIAFLLLLGGRSTLRQNWASGIGVTSIAISLLLSIYTFYDLWQQGGAWLKSWTWLTVEERTLSVGIFVDELNALMVVLVSLISLLVYIYARSYMENDDRFTTFYAYLTLFSASMLALVLSPSLIQMYLFWELVGLGSFLLIGFWYQKASAKRAAQKAFLITRVGDIGFFIALLLLFWQVGSLDISVIIQAVEAEEGAPLWIMMAGIFLFIGAMGKSGQFPLHTWLPDAMEGPTPVSALIHAATMVAAGVYLVARIYPLFLASTTLLNFIVFVGIITALFAASVALVETDVKRILAFSTVSQLGFMMVALGSMGYVAGIFHLLTHATFKALLFLVAGGMILLYRKQELGEISGLRQKNKHLASLLVIGCLVMAGMPPFSGFFSKEEILAAVFVEGHSEVFLLAWLASLLTVLYLFRLTFRVLRGQAKGVRSRDLRASLRWPMYVLAGLALGLGIIQYPSSLLQEWLLQAGDQGVHSSLSLWLQLLWVLLLIITIAFAFFLYGRVATSRQQPSVVRATFQRIVRQQYGMDMLIDRGVVGVVIGLGWFLERVDRYVIRGSAQVAFSTVQRVARWGTALQTGQVQGYLLLSLVALVILFFSLVGGEWMDWS